jgi:hypothetical protein
LLSDWDGALFKLWARVFFLPGIQTGQCRVTGKIVTLSAVPVVTSPPASGRVILILRRFSPVQTAKSALSLWGKRTSAAAICQCSYPVRASMLHSLHFLCKRHNGFRESILYREKREVAPRADVSVTGRGEFSWKPNASPDQLSASQRLLARSAQISAHCCVVVAINKLVRDARVRVPQRSKFDG